MKLETKLNWLIVAAFLAVALYCYYESRGLLW